MNALLVKSINMYCMHHLSNRTLKYALASHRCKTKEEMALSVGLSGRRVTYFTVQ